MTDPDHAQRQETAAVVLCWMRRRGMTRQVFADRMGKSLSWVDKIRAGDRQLDRLSVLRQIASVLDIPRMLPGYLPSDGSVWAERLTVCRYRRLRTGRLSKCKFHSHLGLRKVGIHLIAAGPAKVSWSAAGVSEWRGILFNSIEWWYDTFTYLAHATLHRHRPDLPPMLQAQTTRRALGSNDRDPVPNVFRYGVTDITHDKQESPEASAATFCKLLANRCDARRWTTGLR